jgi:hypothetical protein
MHQPNDVHFAPTQLAPTRPETREGERRKQRHRTTGAGDTLLSDGPSYRYGKGGSR